MINRINALFLTRTSGRIVLVWLLVAIASMAIMAAVITPAFQEVTGGLRPLDLNREITAELAYQEVSSYTDESRRLYLWFAFVDYIYPFSAAVFFSLLWALIFNKWPIALFAWLTGRGILLLPFLYTLVDWSENAGFLAIVFAYPTELPAIAGAAAFLKANKSMFLLINLVLSLVFALFGAVQGRRASAA